MAFRSGGLRLVAGVRAAGGPPADAMVSLRMADGGEASFPLHQVQGRQVVASVPWRKARSARGQAHYPGYFWSVTTGGHVIYESLWSAKTRIGAVELQVHGSGMLV